MNEGSLSTKTDQIIGVLTGDLIRSTGQSADQIALARNCIQTAVEHFEQQHGPVTFGPPDFFSGDGWQIAVPSPEISFRLALFIRTSLKSQAGQDTRIAIGFGGADQLNSDRASLSTGEAFILSGRALTNMSSYFDMTLALPDTCPVKDQWPRAMVHMLSAFSNGWTRRQSEIIRFALLHPEATHNDIGANMIPPVRQQTINNALRGANWRAVLEALTVLETTDWLNALGRI